MGNQPDVDDEDQDKGQDWLYELWEEGSGPGESGDDDQTASDIRNAANEGIDIRAPFSCGRYLLQVLALMKYHRAMEVAIERGAEPNDEAEASDNGVYGSSLLEAIEVGDLKGLQILMAAPFDRALELLGSLGETPLQAAARNGNHQMVKMLLDAGADVHAEISLERTIGWTPLTKAVEADAFDIAELLIEHGADPDLQVGLSSSARDEVESGRLLKDRQRQYFRLFEQAKPRARRLID